MNEPLDHILNIALRAVDTRAILLFDEAFTLIAGRGDITDSDIQAVSRVLVHTEADMSGQTPFPDGTLQFHRANTHTLVLIKNIPEVGSPSSIEHVSTSISFNSIDTVKGRVEPRP